MEKEVYWSRFAADFEKRNSYVIGPGDLGLVKKQVENLADLKDTLELGCGDGMFTGILSKRAGHLWATDFSDEMVAVTRHRFKDSEMVTVEKQNCFETTYTDHRFDTVVMINLLHIIPEPGNALKEAKRILKPGGRIVVMSFTTEGMILWHKLGMIYRYLKIYGKPPENGKRLTREAVSGLLSGAGFKTDEIILVGSRCKAIWATAVAD